MGHLQADGSIKEAKENLDKAHKNLLEAIGRIADGKSTYNSQYIEKILEVALSLSKQKRILCG